MNQGSTRRIVATLALGALATSTAACGVARGPIAPMAGYTGASTYGVNTQSADDLRKFGLKFDASTPRVAYVAGSVDSRTPASTDLRAKCSPIQDQGHIGSCTGFASEGLAEFRERGLGDDEQLSPGFVYLMELKTDGNLGQDAGSRISTAVQTLHDYGISTEALHPYLDPADQDNPDALSKYLSDLPSSAAMQDAATRKIPGAQKIANLAAFKQSIAAGKPVIFGIMVYKSFMSADAKKTGVIPQPNPNTEQLLGGHAILAVGYNDAKQQVIFRNSWSTAWGDHGYGYLPYGYFKGNLAGDAWSYTN